MFADRTMYGFNSERVNAFTVTELSVYATPFAGHQHAINVLKYTRQLLAHCRDRYYFLTIPRKRNKQVASVENVTFLFVKIKKILLT